MIVTIKTQGLQSMEQIRAFLKAPTPSTSTCQPAEARYDWIGIADELRRLPWQG